MTFPGLFKEQILPERLESISLSFLVDGMSKQRGGIAPNIAYSMALLGTRPRVMATVGADCTVPFGAHAHRDGDEECLVLAGYPQRYREFMKGKTAPLVVEAESAFRDLDATSANGIQYVKNNLIFPLATGSFEDGMGA